MKQLLCFGLSDSLERRSNLNTSAQVPKAQGLVRFMSFLLLILSGFDIFILPPHWASLPSHKSKDSSNLLPSGLGSFAYFYSYSHFHSEGFFLIYHFQTVWASIFQQGYLCTQYGQSDKNFQHSIDTSSLQNLAIVTDLIPYRPPCGDEELALMLRTALVSIHLYLCKIKARLTPQLEHPQEPQSPEHPQEEQEQGDIFVADEVESCLLLSVLIL